MLTIHDVDTWALLLPLLAITWAAAAPYLIMAGAMATSATAQAIQANRDRQAGAEQANANRQLTESQFNRDLAFRQSQDPFAGQRSQGLTLAQLEALAQLGQARQPSVAGIPYANQSLLTGVPKLTPQTIQALAALQASVRAGRTAPDFSRDANRGRSAVLDLDAVARGEVDPATDAAFSMGMPQRPGATWATPQGTDAYAGTYGTSAGNNTGRFATPRENNMLSSGDILMPGAAGLGANRRRAPSRRA